jgi:hypothetical protein
MDPNALLLTSLKIQSFKSIRGPLLLEPPRKASLIAIVGANGAGACQCFARSCYRFIQSDCQWLRWFEWAWLASRGKVDGLSASALDVIKVFVMYSCKLLNEDFRCLI